MLTVRVELATRRLRLGELGKVAGKPGAGPRL